jgi:hypothetical protein
MFWALLTQLQEVLHNVTWYTACVLCQLAAPGWECSNPIPVQPPGITLKQYTKWRCAASPEAEQVMLEICRGP